MTASLGNAEEVGSLFNRFRTSVISYGLRQIIVAVLSFGTNIVLTRYLMPGQFGQVATITIVITLASLLADGGLGVYLIQRRAEVTAKDLSRTTTIQLLAAASLSGCALGVSVILGLFTIHASVGYMVAVASLSLPLQVIRGMALLKLERTIHINRVVRVELLEHAVYMLVSIFLACQGAGAWSIVFALLCKTAIGSVAAVHIGSFRFNVVRPEWDQDLRDGIHFGLHYQATSLINMARVSIIPLFIVPVLGYDAGGFVERAWFFSSVPLSVITAVQSRTVFPLISRIQQDHQRIKRFIENSIYVSSIVDKIAFLPMLLFIQPAVELIFQAKWLPMLPLMYWLIAGNTVFGALAGILNPVANGLGKSDLLSRLNLYILVLSWVVTVSLTPLFHISAVGISALTLWSATFVLKSKLTIHLGEFSFLRNIARPLAACCMALLLVGALFLMMGETIVTIAQLAGWVTGSIVVYLACLMLLDGRRVLSLVRFILREGQTA